MEKNQKKSKIHIFHICFFHNFCFFFFLYSAVKSFTQACDRSVVLLKRSLDGNHDENYSKGQLSMIHGDFRGCGGLFDDSLMRIYRGQNVISTSSKLEKDFKYDIQKFCCSFFHMFFIFWKKKMQISVIFCFLS